jgi:hypothetical protein
MSITVEITGLDDLGAALTGALADLGLKVEGAVQDATTMCYDSSQAACPVDTGRLKGSGVQAVTGMEGSVAYGGGDAYYGLFVHEGHLTRNHKSFVPPNPWLFTSYVPAKTAFVAACQEIADGG